MIWILLMYLVAGLPFVYIHAKEEGCLLFGDALLLLAFWPVAALHVLNNLVLWKMKDDDE